MDACASEMTGRPAEEDGEDEEQSVEEDGEEASTWLGTASHAQTTDPQMATYLNDVQPRTSVSMQPDCQQLSMSAP